MRDVDEQYRTDDNLRTRVETHQKYTVGPDLEPAVDAALGLVGDERLLDVGTAYGDFPSRLLAAGHRGALVGLDQQGGMVETARRRHPKITFVRGVAERLPFDDASFDVATARHMLYHVPAIPVALREIRRVLRPGGRLLAVTNARDNMAAFWQIVAEAATIEPSLKSLGRGTHVCANFSDDNAPLLLRTAFDEIAESRLLARLEFPSPEPLERYFRSCLPGSEISDPNAAVAAFRAALAARWPASAPFVVAKTILLYTAIRSH